MKRPILLQHAAPGMRARLASLLALLITLLVTGSAHAQLKRTPNSPAKLPGAKVEVYKTVGDVELNVFRYEPKGHTTKDRRPAAVFFFGGGWRGGTVTQFVPQCKYLASRGMVAMVADYRVSSRHKTKAIACVSDAKSAVRWIRANADRLGVDPNRIVAGGGSAGGHIAACTGVVPGWEESGEDTSISSVPDAMVLFNPALVLAAIDGKEPFDEKRMAGLTDRVGADPKAISPYHHVKKGNPPTLILHGKGDAIVDYRTAEQFNQAMNQAGNACQLNGYEGQPHGFFNYGRGDGSMYINTTRAMDMFLASLGYLQGEPALKVTTTAKLPAKEKFHLYLLIGQSNMAGRGKVTARDKKPDVGILMFNKAKAWVPAVDPVHFDKTIAGVGLARGFARAMKKENPDVTIGLIPCAVGGTPLIRWQSDGDLYKQAIVRAKAAMKAGTLRGVLWHQGEADSKELKTANSYAQRLRGMVGDLRTALASDQVPFVAGTLGEFIHGHKRLPHTEIVNEAIMTIDKSDGISFSGVADSRGLKHKGDGVHFDRESYLELGSRYAKVMSGLQKSTGKR